MKGPDNTQYTKHQHYGDYDHVDQLKNDEPEADIQNLLVACNGCQDHDYADDCL